MNVFESIIGRLDRGVLLWGLLLSAMGVIVLFMYLSSALVRDLAEQERARMQIWAEATREIAESEGAENIDFLLKIIEDNDNIPVMLVDSAGCIVLHRNFALPEPVDSLNPLDISDANQAFLIKKLNGLKRSDNCIDIELSPRNVQHLYYEDSSLLRRLNYFPYIQLLVMCAFVALVYFSVSASKRAEQNRVWVGLSKETAHQLGTPISSLMAWMDILAADGVDGEVIAEMDKDVSRLSVVASRFSKIGSAPSLAVEDVGDMVRRITRYMSSRIPPSVNLSVDIEPGTMVAKASGPLLEWVIENLIKNAVDAMSGSGNLEVKCCRAESGTAIEVTDTGRGLIKKHFKSVFRPGFTTKERGWGLGLTLAKRIVEEYHGGRIFVKCSEPGVGSTFRIELPLIDERKSNDG